jgi:hypothetical protein
MGIISSPLSPGGCAATENVSMRVEYVMIEVAGKQYVQRFVEDRPSAEDFRGKSR